MNTTRIVKFTGWVGSFRVLVSLKASFDPVPDYFDPTVGSGYLAKILTMERQYKRRAAINKELEA